MLGNRSIGCAWTFFPGALNKSSVVYSAGVGKDISFEHALVEQYGCTVVLLDPSPTGMETIARPENQIPEFNFLPVALARACGDLTLAPPGNPEEGSWFAHNNPSAGIKVSCMDLQSVMRQNGHASIDLLKLDIEGIEYEVIDGLLNHNIPVRQVCVEFHHSMLAFPDIRRSHSIRSIVKLVLHGYKLVDVDGGNHTFVKPAPPSQGNKLILL